MLLSLGVNFSKMSTDIGVYGNVTGCGRKVGGHRRNCADTFKPLFGSSAAFPCDILSIALTVVEIEHIDTHSRSRQSWATMTTEEPQAMPASRIDAEDSSGVKGAGFLPKPFATRDCPSGMRIRGGRPMQSLKETYPKHSEEKRGDPRALPR